jgi:flagellum-specific ATP synthase
MKVHPLLERLRSHDPVLRTGRVSAIHATAIEADGPGVPLGTICTVDTVATDGATLQAEVIRLESDRVVLSPIAGEAPTFIGARVAAVGESGGVPAGDGCLGRAMDAFGRPIDGAGPIRHDFVIPLVPQVPGPLERTSPDTVFVTGIRAIDACLTLGLGQRVGIFAPSGAGKTTLMTQIVRQAEAEVTILCLIGERGREVEAIWRELKAGPRSDQLALVAATSDQTAPMRVRAANYAMALADHWRARGKNVLLVVDSVTRLAMALREVGLAAGEPPTVRAYTPGVFAAIPRFVERCGALRAGGSITAIMTVLSEGEDMDDPVCEMMKSVLDGHILLSRVLAERGHFPAIDMPRSISRQSRGLVSDRHLRASRRVREWISQYETSRTLIEAGLYSAGSNADIDRAIEKRPGITAFLRQDTDDFAGFDSTLASLERLAGAVA